MITLYDIKQVTLLPTITNQGHPGGKVNFSVKDKDEITGFPDSLPIFTSPMECIIDNTNVKLFTDKGIKPVIPGVESIDIRLNLCSWVFCAFSLLEIEKYFLRERRQSNSQFHICIDAGNGHDLTVLKYGLQLKKEYGNQVLLMGGNVAFPEVYKDYSIAGFDYMRVGIASSSVSNKNKYGFHYPMASLLDDIKNYRRNGAGKSLRPVKVIADGGITCFSDIIKCIACGADFVMIGHEFARTIEAAGSIYKKQKSPQGKMEFIEVNRGSVLGWSGDKARGEGLQRRYYGNTSEEIRIRRNGESDSDALENGYSGYISNDALFDWVRIDYSLDEWIEDFKEVAYYAFMMTSSLGWEDFKKNARYGIDSDLTD